MADSTKHQLKDIGEVLEFFRSELDRFSSDCATTAPKEDRQRDKMVVNICGACGLEPSDDN